MFQIVKFFSTVEITGKGCTALRPDGNTALADIHPNLQRQTTAQPICRIPVGGRVGGAVKPWVGGWVVPV
jgi:hypothetical protein